MLWRNSLGEIIRDALGVLLRCPECPCDSSSSEDVDAPCTCPSGLSSTYTVTNLIAEHYNYSSGDCTGDWGSGTRQLRYIGDVTLDIISSCFWRKQDIEIEMRLWDTSSEQWGPWEPYNGQIRLQLFDTPTCRWALDIAVLSGSTVSNIAFIYKDIGLTPVGLYEGDGCTSQGIFGSVERQGSASVT